MATYNWSTLTNGQSIAFNPATDVLNFNLQAYAADLLLGLGSSSTSFTFGGKTVTLMTAPETLAVTNVTFAFGSVLRIGNGTTGTAGDAAANTLNGTTSHDQLLGLGGNDTLSGGSGNDALDGGTGDDSLIGGDGDDTLTGGTGADTLQGGTGDDTYIVDASDVLVAESAGPGALGVESISDTVIAAINYSIQNITWIENLTLTGTAVQGTGNVNNNRLTGNSAANNLVGLDGDDTLNGSGGIDTLVGGTGSDVYIVNNVNDVVTETSNDPGAASAGPGALSVQGITDTVRAVIDYSLEGIQFVENITLTGTAATNGSGNGLDNEIIGNGASNQLTGNAGNDTLDGRAGVDTLTGGSGNDVLIWDTEGGRFLGGLGTDTLKIEGAGILYNMNTHPNMYLDELEVINIAGTGNNTLQLDGSIVIAISPTTDTLRINGNAGDVVDTTDNGWLRGADQVIGTNNYYSYTKDIATLLIDSDITQSGVT